MNFSNDQKIEIYRDLVESRLLGEKIVEYIFSGKIAGAIHPPLGQETVCAAINNSDKISDIKTYMHPTHRMQCAQAYRVGFQPFISELLGKQGGTCGGIAGEYHLTGIEYGLLPATGGLGAAWGSDIGFAWALKHSGKKREVVIAPYGDGAVSQGVTYEAMNIAKLYNLPVVFLIENNGIAMSTPLSKQSPIENLADRGEAFAMKHVTVDGNDVLALTEALLNGMELAANFEPNIIEAKNLVRWQGHYVGDRQEAYRDLTFLKDLDSIDPVLKFEKQLREEGILDDAKVEEIKKDKIDMIVAAFDVAISQEPPTKEQVLDITRLFANPEGGEL
ncbi:MAG: thiamine pyrophosphate-dependent dehydrogenase E1 component subunit alpha [Eubacterium sp.]|nr:thiamine pyrophosphate-dependent dehydrogenase E1 component subunit alpha [Eubacterium sp.]